MMNENENAYRMRRAGDVPPGAGNQSEAEDEAEAGAPLGAAEVLLRAAEVAYGKPRQGAPGPSVPSLAAPVTEGCAGDENCERARLLVNGMLEAARAGGYAQVDLLKTLLFLQHRTPHVMLMTQAAVSAAGGKAIRELYVRLGR
jgi:hypothetical protein